MLFEFVIIQVLHFLCDRTVKLNFNIFLNKETKLFYQRIMIFS